MQMRSGAARSAGAGGVGVAARSRAPRPAASAAPARKAPRAAAVGVGTSAGTAIVAWPLPLLRRPGTYSSSTAWKLVPPKPNALTPATRVAPSGTSQSRRVVLTANGADDQSTFGLGRSKPRLGTRVLWW